MQKYFSVILDSTSRQGVPGATILVTDHYTGLVATLYKDDEITIISNPITVGGTGEVEFNVEAGVYDFLIVKNGDEKIVTKVGIGGTSGGSNGTNVVLNLKNGTLGSIPAGQVVYITSNDTFGIADSDIATDAIERSQLFLTNTVVASAALGQVTSYGVVSSLAGGVAGQLGYLSQTGTITNTVPSIAAGDRYLVILGRWISASKFFWNPQLPILL